MLWGLQSLGQPKVINSNTDLCTVPWKLLQKSRLDRAEMIPGSTIKWRSVTLGEGSLLLASLVPCKKEAIACDALWLSHRPSLVPQHQWVQEGIFNDLWGTPDILSLTYSDKIGSTRALNEGVQLLNSSLQPILGENLLKCKSSSNDLPQPSYKYVCMYVYKNILYIYIKMYVFDTISQSILVYYVISMFINS